MMASASAAASAPAARTSTRLRQEERLITNGHTRELTLLSYFPSPMKTQPRSFTPGCVTGGQQALEKLALLRDARIRNLGTSNHTLVGECTHKTIWSFAFKFDLGGDTFVACHWDVEKCRSDQYVQPLWNPTRGCVEGTEYNDHLLHLEKTTAVLRALENPLRYCLRIIEADLADAEKNSRNPKHIYHVYCARKDTEEMLKRAQLPFRDELNAEMLKSVSVVKRCVARGGNLKRLFSVLYRAEKDVDKPAYDGRPRKAKRLNSTGAVTNEIRTACNPMAPICGVCKHRHHQGQSCPMCGHVGIAAAPVSCSLNLAPSPGARRPSRAAARPICPPATTSAAAATAADELGMAGSTRAANALSPMATPLSPPDTQFSPPNAGPPASASKRQTPSTRSSAAQAAKRRRGAKA